MSVTFYPNYCHYLGFGAAAEPTITGQGFVSSGGESSGAAYDLLDDKRTSLVTVDTSGETVEFEIDFDMTTNLVDPTFYILDNHNLKTADAKVIFEIGGVASSNAGPAYNGTLGGALTLVEDVDGVVTPSLDGILLVVMGPTMDDHHFEINVNDVSTFDADVTLGEVSVGISFTPTTSPNLPVPISYGDGSSMLESAGGKRYGFTRHGVRKGWKLTWPFMSAANKTSLETVFLVTGGMKHPFYIDLGETASTTPTLHLVRFMSPRLDFTQVTGNAYSITLDIEEEL